MMTMQYIKIDGNGDLVIPVEVTATQEAANSAFGQGNWVLKDIPDDVCIRCLQPELDGDGEVQVDQAAVDAEQAVKDSDQHHVEAHLHLGDIKANINIATAYDSLTDIEKKALLGQMPTDQEFIDAGYTFTV